MKLIAFEQEAGSVIPEDDQDLLKAEAARVYKLYLSGYIREIYFTENHRAVIILECENQEEATNILNSLPLVRNGKIRFDLIQLLPYTGLNRVINS